MKRLALATVLVCTFFAMDAQVAVPLLWKRYNSDPQLMLSKVDREQQKVDWVKKWRDEQSEPLPTGRFRTVRGTFTTIYSPKFTKGWVLEREMQIAGIPYWEPVGYSRRKLLFFKKKYGLWEIYNPTLKR